MATKRNRRLSAQNPIDQLFAGQPESTKDVVRIHKSIRREDCRQEFMERIKTPRLS